MAKIAVIVTCLIAFFVGNTFAYKKECAVGPQYWCQSFKTAQDCGALRHCTDTVWRYEHNDAESDKSIHCEWCRKIIRNVHQGFERIHSDKEWLQSTLVDACKLLPTVETVTKCTQVMTNYSSSVISLMKHNQYDTLCKLMDICSSETTATEPISADKPTEKIPLNSESKMLCHVIVRVTHELHNKEHKNQEQIQTFLDTDCEKLPSSHLVKKCKSVVHQHAKEIYGHVASNVELSKVCDYLGEFDDHTLTSISSSTYCNVCQFVVANAQYMLSSKLTEDKVLSYIDEQVCARLTGESKKACQTAIIHDDHGLLHDLQLGFAPALFCTKFQVCIEQSMSDETSVSEDHLKTFVQTNICEKLGSLSSACLSLMNHDSTGVFQALINHVNGKELCHLFGLCPTTSVMIDEANLTDDPAKCTRCIKDFTRRKHIAERLLNHSSEFLHHFCSQLPDEQKCTEAINGSFNELREFIEAIDPHDICVQLNMCDSSNTESYTVSDSELVIQDEAFTYLKNNICPKTGSVSAWCTSWLEAKGRPLISETFKLIEHSRVCEVLDVCADNSILQQCSDKNQCCENKINAYKLKIAQFLKTMVASTRTMCNYMPAREICLNLADIFDSNVNNAMSSTESRSICTTIVAFSSENTNNLHETSCQTCAIEWDSRRSRFQMVFNKMMSLISLWKGEPESQSSIETVQQNVLAMLDSIKSNLVCTQMGYCATTPDAQPTPIQLPLRTLAKNKVPSFDERLSFQDICSLFQWPQTICQHLLMSPNNHHYALIYEAFMLDNPATFTHSVQRSFQTKAHSDGCTVCKNAVQTTKDFWLDSLDQIHDVLIQSCERFPVKDQCQAFFNQQYENIKTYINTIDSDLFCQSLSLCSSKPVVQLQTEIGSCNTCIQRLNQRKEVLRLGVDRLTNYLTGICQRFELKPCQNFLQQLKQTFQTTINTWNSEEICTHVGFCSTTGSSSAVSFDQYETYLKTQFENEICSDLGPFQTWCQQMLNGNHEQIQTVKINENLRDLMQIGESKDENLLSAVNQYKCENDRCECCIDRINRKKNYLKYRATQVFKILIQACDYCPVKDQCQKYWTDEENKCLPSIDNIDSKQTCVQMGFCNASSLCSKMGVFQEECEHVLNNFIQLNQQEKAELVKDLPKTSVVVLSKEETKTAVDDSKTNCILCEYMMKILSKYIHQGSTEEEIEKSLEQVCNRMPSNLKQQCDEFIENYGSVIIATLVQELDLTKLCKKLNICTKTMNFQVESLSKPNMAACGICDYVSTYVHFALKRNPSDASLQEALSKVCTHLSSEQTSQCEMLVQLFGPQMRHLQLDLGENFCQHLAICESVSETSTSKTIVADKIIEDVLETELDKTPSILDNPETREKIVKNLDETPQCLICRYAVSYLDAVLKNNKSEEAIQEALAKVCKLLPEKERAECNEFIKTYGPVLAELIVDLADPDSVCRYLGVCQVVLPSESTVKTPKLIGGDHHDYVNHVPKETTYTCTICQFVVTRMKGFIELNQTEEEILASMKSSCDLFSVVHLKQQCLDFLDKYGPYLIQMVSSDIDPKEACENIGACEKTSPAISYEEPKTTSPSPKSSTVAGKCIFGMSYWCTSRQNAELCNAVELCEQLVWSSKSKNIVI